MVNNFSFNHLKMSVNYSASSYNAIAVKVMISFKSFKNLSCLWWNWEKLKWNWLKKSFNSALKKYFVSTSKSKTSENVFVFVFIFLFVSFVISLMINEESSFQNRNIY